MNEHSPFDPDSLAPPASESVRTLILALLLLAGIVVGVMSCGSGDLTFPGQIPFTETPNNTVTPIPTATPFP